MKTISSAALTVFALLLPISSLAGDGSGDPAAGEAVYDETCFACHGEDGTGAIPGAPDFTKATGVLTKNDSVLLEHILNGFQSPGAVMEMPPKGGNDALTVKDIRDALSFLHQKFHYGTYK